MSKTAVVTGATGFIGGAFTEYLLEYGYSVIAVVRDKSKMSLSSPRLSCVEADFSEYARLGELIPHADIFYHFAWDGTIGEPFKDFHRQMNNASFAADAFVAANAMGCKKFILASTIVALESKRFMNIDACNARWSCIYGTAKASAEMLCKVLSYQLGLPLNTAFLASVYGEGDNTNKIQNALIRALLKGESIKLVSGENLYDWIYIDDVVRALVAIGESGKDGKSYYVGHRKLQTFGELVTRTRDVIAPNVPLKFGEIEGKSEVDYSTVDLNALYDDTGFECSADFEQSIRATAEWLSKKNL